MARDASGPLQTYFRKTLPRFITGWRHQAGVGRVGFHRHEHMEIVYHASGTGYAELPDGSRTDFEAGAVAVYPARFSHAQVSSSGTEDCCVHVQLTGTPPAVLRACHHLPALEKPHLKRELLLLSGLPERISRAERAAADLRTGAALLELMELSGKRSRRGSADPALSHAQRARRYIDEHYQTLSELGEVAAELGLSASYLRHAFRHAYDQSLISYLGEVRIDRAKSLLTHSRLAHKTIAELCGFSNERYLSTTFRAAVGCTPGEFRAQARTR